MERGFDIYNKIVFFLTMLAILVVGFIIKYSEDVYTWYRLLNAEAVLLSIWAIATLEFITTIHFKVRLREYIHFFVLALSVFLIYQNKDFISSQPNTIDIKYIAIKFGIIGAVFYILPFLLHGYNKSIRSILKLLSLVASLFIFSHIFTDRYKLSTAGFVLTSLFFVIMFILSNKEKQHLNQKNKQNKAPEKNQEKNLNKNQELDKPDDFNQQ